MSAGHTAVTTPTAPDEPVIVCDTPQDECGVRDVLDRLGDKWSVYVVVELASGIRRFKELQRAVPGNISQRMLTLTVRRLERDGLVKRTVYPTVPPQVEYELTDLGHSLTHLVKALADWSIAHRPAIAAAREAWDAVDGNSGRLPVR
ncbi:winged helix-turn-helix transcriptional regulator [Streptomyces sp. WM6386]|uniref:winged helix-turn-helix transcriptional regulator n=1 Tax=Streptomyces sp. WM6386 TaxID=1415558 RepID=UPI000619EB4D|nr:helix-turn-helix domain-containing protein [Streptomyces sp. WM6386]KKD03193.1 HxlR family transcriptional regulator [Streptomyces sp. WM6386]